MSTSSPADLAIVWSKHAKERLSERFGSSGLAAPTGLLQLIGCQKQETERFRVRVGRAVFVCTRAEDCILIVTVAKYGDNYKPQKGKSRRKTP